MILRKVVSAVPVATLAWSGLGHAQPSEGQSESFVQEIVVTATRQSESLSRVPISVAAITQEQLEAKGVKNIDDIVRLTPGININRGGNNTNNVAIRGIASSAGASTTGIYIDDIPIQTRNLGYAAGSGYPLTFDLERVEVLRGPQGTLFGAGSQGGTVRFIQPKPSLSDYTGHARAEIFETDGDMGYEAGAAFGGPIVDGRLGFRASAYYRRDAGWVDAVKGTFGVVDPSGQLLGDSITFTPERVVHEDTNWRESKSARLALTWAVTDSLSITPSVFYQREYAHDVIDDYWVSLSNPSKGVFRIPRFEVVPPDATHTAFEAPSAQPSTDEFVVTSLKLEYETDNFIVISDTSYFDRDVDQTIDHTILYTEFNARAVPLPGDIAVTDLKDRQENFTQEIRVQSADPQQRLTWVVGAFYSDNEQASIQWERQNFFALVDDPYGFGVVADGPPFGPGYSAFMNTFGVMPLPDGTSYFGDFRTREKQLAAFGQVDFKLTDRWKLTAGLRVAKSEISYSAKYDGPEQNVNAPFGRPCMPEEAPCIPGTGAFVPDYGGGSASNKENYITPKVSASFQMNDDNLFYATVSKGFRPAGAQARLTSACNSDLIANGFVDANGNADAPTGYDSDYVWNYELGSKNNLFDGRLVLDGSVYLIKWSDRQGNIGMPVCASQLTTNLGEVTSRGFDLGVRFQPTLDLTLGLNVGYNKTTYDETLMNQSNGRIIFSEGARVAGSGAPWLVSLDGQYNFFVGDLEFYVRGDFTHTTEGYVDTRAGNYDPLSRPAEDASLLNSRIGVIIDNADISLFVNNVLDSHPSLDFARSGVGRAIYTDRTFRPRTMGVSAVYRF